MKKQIRLAAIFRDEPKQWGLRGDPYLWGEMAGRFASIPCPATPDGIDCLIEEAFAELKPLAEATLIFPRTSQTCIKTSRNLRDGEMATATTLAV